MFYCFFWLMCFKFEILLCSVSVYTLCSSFDYSLLAWISGQLPPEKNCRPVRVGIWLRVSFGVGGQFSSEAIVLEPSLTCCQSILNIFKLLIFEIIPFSSHPEINKKVAVIAYIKQFHPWLKSPSHLLEDGMNFIPARWDKNKTV